MSIAEQTYDFSRAFPASELYGLTTQMRRAAVSTDKEEGLLAACDELGRMLRALIRSLERNVGSSA